MLETTAIPTTTATDHADVNQQTLAGPVSVSGKGLLLGEDALVTMLPAPPNHGIVFERTDVSPPVQIPALVKYIARRARRSTLSLSNTSIETIEHCMSAFAGLRIDNALIKIDGPELPCGDGSASPFVDPILEVGLVEQDEPRRVFRSEPVRVFAKNEQRYMTGSVQDRMALWILRPVFVSCAGSGRAGCGA